MIRAAGCLLLAADTHKLCFQLRNKDTAKHPLTWSFWGGKSENSETPVDTLRRELKEELDLDYTQVIKLYPLHTYTSRDKEFEYQAYVALVKEEFIPRLNSESSGYAWVSIDCYPKPLHQGAKNILYNSRVNRKLENIITSL
jgi:8-oxo-dGTP pyrophosphatase MutT (NUDIX family)